MKRQKKQNLQAFLFVIPALIILGLFVFYPLVKNVIYSFQSFGLSDVEKEWVGLENYRKLFSDKTIPISLKNNLRYAIVSIA